MAPNPDCFQGNYTRVIVFLLLEHAGFIIAYSAYAAVTAQSRLMKSSRAGMLKSAEHMRSQVWGLKKHE